MALVRGGRLERTPRRCWRPDLCRAIVQPKNGMIPMIQDRKVTLFHSPNTRTSGVLILLEELGTDVLWGTALTWITLFKLVPALPVIKTCIDRLSTCPSVARVKAKDAEFAAAQGR